MNLNNKTRRGSCYVILCKNQEDGMLPGKIVNAEDACLLAYMHCVMLRLETSPAFFRKRSVDGA